MCLKSAEMNQTIPYNAWLGVPTRGAWVYVGSQRKHCNTFCITLCLQTDPYTLIDVDAVGSTPRKKRIHWIGVGKHIEINTLTNIKYLLSLPPSPTMAKLRMLDYLHRGVVYSCVGLSIYAITMAVLIHRDTMRRGQGE